MTSLFNNQLSQSDIDELNRLVELGYVSKRKHPSWHLYVYKYTKTWEIDSRNESKTNLEYISKWTGLMKTLRGLVLDDEYRIVSKPFNKFFNIEDVDYQHPLSAFHVYEKLDGSAIVVSKWHGYLVVNTLGSFESDQAIKARQLLTTVYTDWLHLLLTNHTYIFEIIYPENQIVIRYDNQERLVLIGITRHYTGNHFEELDIQNHEWPHKATVYSNYQAIDEIIPLLKTSAFKNEEGFVIWWKKEQYRLKFKYAEYFRIHKIRSQLSPKYIWELLSTGKDLTDLNDLPDEFVQEIIMIKTKLLDQYQQELIKAQQTYKMILLSMPEKYTRKDFALIAKNYAISAILFKMIENKEYSAMIWKLIELDFNTKYID